MLWMGFPSGLLRCLFSQLRKVELDMYKLLLWYNENPGFAFGDCSETLKGIIDKGNWFSLQAHLNPHHRFVIYYGDTKIGECTNGSFIPFGT